MKRLIGTLFFLIVMTQAHAQINELGVFLGGANYIGDIGKTTYIAPHELALGAIYKWNRSPRHSWRFSIIHSKITANDDDSDVPARHTRSYDFENSVTEFTGGMEFNFFDFNLHELERKFTPYVFTGASYFLYHDLIFDNGEAKTAHNGSSLAIPMIVGIKTTILPKLILGFEVGARYTFTDNLDGSFPDDNRYAAARFGNTNSKDWYVFTGFTLTYTFTEKPCYCAN